MTPQTTIIYILIFGCAFMAAQFSIGMGKQARKSMKHNNFRMRLLEQTSDKALLDAKLLTARGLDADGNIVGAMRWLKQLVLRSGLHIGIIKIGIAMVVIGVVLAVGLYIFKGNILLSIAGLLAGLALPILALIFLAKRRRAKAASQLPEALTTIVRSLRAGHPVPVAIDLVAREMPDPIGSDFGVVNDEITYGTSLGAAVQRLADRIGHSDFDLFAANVRLQAATGGNLTELLSANASTIRARQKMRLKVKAATSEGRMSALILNMAPILLFAAINFMSPGFYSSVENQEVLKLGLICAGVWMMLGNLVMRRMINFKI